MKNEDPMMGLVLFVSLGFALMDIGIVQEETGNWLLAIGSGIVAWPVSAWLLCEVLDRYSPRG